MQTVSEEWNLNGRILDSAHQLISLPLAHGTRQLPAGRLACWEDGGRATCQVTTVEKKPEVFAETFLRAKILLPTWNTAALLR